MGSGIGEVGVECWELGWNERDVWCEKWVSDVCLLGLLSSGLWGLLWVVVVGFPLLAATVRA